MPYFNWFYCKNSQSYDKNSVKDPALMLLVYRVLGVGSRREQVGAVQPVGRYSKKQGQVRALTINVDNTVAVL